MGGRSGSYVGRERVSVQAEMGCAGQATFNWVGRSGSYTSRTWMGRSDQGGGYFTKFSVPGSAREQKLDPIAPKVF